MHGDREERASQMKSEGERKRARAAVDRERVSE